MPTAPYFLRDGTPVPGVTTVIGASLAWNRDALMKWAWRMGREGRDYDKVRQKAADAGTIAHEMAEAHIMGRTYIPPEGVALDVMRRGVAGFNAFMRWFRGTKLKPIACEIKLVSERYRVGGTPDVLFLDTNERVLLGDFKTSAKVYPDHLIQTTAYTKIIEEVMGIECESVELLALGRHTARFTHYSYPAADLLPAWQTFTRLRELYDLRWAVEGIARN